MGGTNHGTHEIKCVWDSKCKVEERKKIGNHEKTHGLRMFEGTGEEGKALHMNRKLVE